MFTRFLLLICGLTMIFGSFANTDSYDPLKISQYNMVQPPVCEYKGKQVEYYAVPENFLWNIGAALGYSVRFNQYVVFVDKDNLPNFPPEFQYWMLLHECSHHKLGHTDLSGEIPRGFNDELIIAETDADCYATTRMVKEGFTDKQFEEVVAGMTDNKLNADATRGLRKNPRVEKAHSRTTTSRVNDLRICMKRGENIRE